ncbi:MAG: hypothetical protein PGN09_09120 [Sphingomonas fennica]
MALAAVVAPQPARHRLACGAAALTLATLGDSAVAILWGAPPPFADAARGVGAGLLWWAILVAAAAVFRSRAMLLAAGIAALLVPGVLPLWQRAVARPDPPAADPPAVAVLSGLPLFWGDARERASAAVLGRRLALHPIDSPDAATLARHRLLLIAQPRPPGPAGLVAIDGWLRAGGRAVILTDPALRWAGDRRPDDPLHPPETDGLAPLLAHWGLRLAEDRPQVAPLDVGRRRLLLVDPGRFVATAPGACRTYARGRMADCAIGRGRALLIADADLLHPDAWIGAGTDRAQRLADNVVFVADLAEGLGGRRRHAAAVDWRRR